MEREFTKQLAILREKYANGQKNTFNIFTVLHKKHDERRLHSRFIATLLNPIGSHGQGYKFLNRFLEIIDIKDFDLNDVVVYPTEDEKSEWENVDILIKNKNKAIVIENKIFAGDSNKKMEDGRDKAQLLNYYEKVKRELALSDDQAREYISLVYLTLNGKNPSLVEQLDMLGLKLKLIDYIQFIPLWLNECIVDMAGSLLKDSIKQYIDLVKSITNDFDLTMKLRQLINDDINEAYKLNSSNNRSEDIDFFKGEFKHVKWHTVHEFWHDLANSLVQKFRVNVNVPKDDLITIVTHKKAKRNLVLDFEYRGRIIYISNDSKGFTWGFVFLDSETNFDIKGLDLLQFNVENGKAWKVIEGLEHITFSDFSREDTFKLIMYEERMKVIERIVLDIDVDLRHLGL